MWPQQQQRFSEHPVVSDVFNSNFGLATRCNINSQLHQLIESKRCHHGWKLLEVSESQNSHGGIQTDGWQLGLTEAEFPQIGLNLSVNLTMNDCRKIFQFSFLKKRWGFDYFFGGPMCAHEHQPGGRAFDFRF